MKATIGRSLIEFFLFWAVVLALLALSYWSFIQTLKFFEAGNQDKWAALMLAVAAQFGQNLMLAGAELWKGRLELSPKLKVEYSYLWLSGFCVLAFIDAATNIGEWRRLNPETANILTLVSVVMYAVCVAVVFVEELVGIAAATALYKTNDLLESLGFNRVPAFDFDQRSSFKAHPQQTSFDARRFQTAEDEYDEREK